MTKHYKRAAVSTSVYCGACKQSVGQSRKGGFSETRRILNDHRCEQRTETGNAVLDLIPPFARRLLTGERSAYEVAQARENRRYLSERNKGTAAGRKASDRARERLRLGKDRPRSAMPAIYHIDNEELDRLSPAEAIRRIRGMGRPV